MLASDEESRFPYLLCVKYFYKVGDFKEGNFVFFVSYISFWDHCGGGIGAYSLYCGLVLRDSFYLS